MGIGAGILYIGVIQNLLFKMRRIAIIGSAAFGQQIVDTIENDSIESFEIAGYFDDFAVVGSKIKGYPVLGKIDSIVELYHQDRFDCVFIAIGYKHFAFKETVYNKIKNRIPLANIICKTAFIHPTSKIGEGVLIASFAIVNKNATIEDDVCITLRSIVNHDCLVDKHTFFSTSVSTAGNVKIGKRCFIGIGCILSDGISVADDVWLSPGVVLGKDINSSGHYIGYSMKVTKL